MPDKVKVPAPVLVSAPVVAVLTPAMTKLLVETSIVDVLPALNMKLRFVNALDPVYFKVPPSSTSLVASAVA